MIEASRFACQMLEEHVYSGSGTNQGNTYYYSLAGRLIGSKDANGTVFYMTDALGSILASFTNAAGGATLKGNQVFGPYGNARSYQGTINTAKGFTGQYNDSLTGLDYYNARYYDPVAGVFLSADTVQGNGQGMNPYAYVNGNPETNNDPTGQRPISVSGDIFGGGRTDSPTYEESFYYRWATSTRLGSGGLPALLDMYLYNHQLWVLAESFAENQLHTTTYLLLGQEAFFLIRESHLNWNANTTMRLLYMKLNGMALSATLAVAGLGIEGSPLATMQELERITAESVRALGGSSNISVDDQGNISSKDQGGPCSFTFETQVTTSHGKKAIGDLHTGDKVLAYNTKTRRMEQEAILHVWINHDNDLIDLTLTATTAAQQGKAATVTSETIHTNKKHPFLTKEKGFLAVGQITLGMHVLRANGTYGVVTGWKLVHGTQVMYNLEVAQDHTFMVGDGQWVVHNSDGGGCGDESFGDITKPVGSFTKVSDKYLKQMKINAHAFKYDQLGQGAPISQFDIYKDSDGNLYLLRKGADMSTAIDTGWNINDPYS